MKKVKEINSIFIQVRVPLCNVQTPTVQAENSGPAGLRAGPLTEEVALTGMTAPCAILLFHTRQTQGRKGFSPKPAGRQLAKQNRADPMPAPAGNSSWRRRRLPVIHADSDWAVNHTYTGRPACMFSPRSRLPPATGYERGSSPQSCFN